MLTSSELKKIPIFSCLNDTNLMWLSQQAADLHLEPGEYLIHEGEPTPFFVVMAGTTEVLKDVMGRRTEISEHKPGDFFGELAILMATAAPASVRAKTACHLARLDPQHLQELIRRSPECSAVILQTLNERVQVVQKYMLSLPSSRVKIVGSRFDDDCRETRAFLSMNRIPYEWADRDRSAHLVPTDQACEVAGLSVVVDGSFCVSHPPTVRKVADALGFQTAPHRQSYDVVIIGGGPAGLAAAVYGASEGLSVLLVERRAPGGQAGTSSRIENYLGFPNGISGDDLSQRAFRQAVKFGAEVVLTREVREIIPQPNSAYTIGIDGGDSVDTKTVILATGVAWRRLDADGVDRFIGRGVLYGVARAETPTVAGKRVFIIGGGNSAGQAALFFADYASSVTLLVRGEDLKGSMSQYLIDQIALVPGIRVETETQVVSADASAFDGLPLTLTATTGSGQHLFFKHPGIPLKNSTSQLADGVDVRADAGYVVGAPSLHANGKRYAWIDESQPLAELPSSWLATLTTMTGNTGQVHAEDSNPFEAAPIIHEGERNDTLYRLGCALRGQQAMERGQIVSVLLEYNAAKCDPPLDDQEVIKITDSVCKLPPEHGPKKSAKRKEECPLYWFPFNTREWFSDQNVMLMNDAQTGWLIRLQALAWDGGGFLTGDKDKLWRLAKSKSKRGFERDCGLVLADYEEVQVDGECKLRHTQLAPLYAKTLELWMKKKAAAEFRVAKRDGAHSEQPPSIAA